MTGGTVENEERALLVTELLRQLEERGAPQGTWLVEIERVRGALRDADALLLHLHDAIIRAAAAQERPDEA